MKKVFIACTIAAVLSGCATPVPKQETYNLIKEELAKDILQNESTAAVVNEAVPIKAQAPKEKRFNVAINNAQASQFFYAVASDTPYNIVVHPDVTGLVSANLKNVTLRETLDVIRDIYGYDYRIDGNRITIRPRTLQTRIFEVNYITGARVGMSETRVNSGSVGDTAGTSPNNNTQNNQNQQGSTQNTTQQAFHSSQISTKSNHDFWAELKISLDSILGDGKDGRNITISPQSGIIVVKAMPDEMRVISDYLKATQVAVNREVMLEAKILEVQLNTQSQSGVNWASFGNYRNGTRRLSAGLLSPGSNLAPLSNSAPTPLADASVNSIAGQMLGAAATAQGSLLGLAFQTSNFAALISFLETQGTVHTLSAPSVRTMNNQKALLKVGTEDFFVTNASSTTTTGTATTSTPSVTLQPFFSGIVLDVTPQISDDGHISLHVHPTVSEVKTNNRQINLGVNSTLNLPLASSTTSESDSYTRGVDRQIFAIGGLMRQGATFDSSQIPGASSIPGGSALLGNTSQTLQKRELVILIKPTIINDANQNYGLQSSLNRIDSIGESLVTKTVSK